MPDGGFDRSLFANVRTMDRGPPSSPVQRARRAERQYGINLRKVARFVGDIVKQWTNGTIEDASRIGEALNLYAKAITPWAGAVATRMIAEVNQRDRVAWREQSAHLSRALRDEIENAPTGQVMRGLLDDQVSLIISLPTEAAQRVHRLTTEGMLQGTRSSEIAKEIMRTGEVTEARAKLIARTEVGRTATALTQARAQSVGSVAYIWRTAGDAQVRPSHKAMNGQVVRWDDPPTLDKLKGHAGAVPNCRCIPLPILPEE